MSDPHSLGGPEADPGLDFFFRHFQLQGQGIGEAVGQVGQAGQQVQVHDLRIGKVFLQLVEIDVGNFMWRPSQPLDVGQGCPLFFTVARVVSLF